MFLLFLLIFFFLTQNSTIYLGFYRRAEGRNLRCSQNSKAACKAEKPCRPQDLIPRLIPSGSQRGCGGRGEIIGKAFVESLLLCTEPCIHIFSSPHLNPQGRPYYYLPFASEESIQGPIGSQWWDCHSASTSCNLNSSFFSHQHLNKSAPLKIKQPSIPTSLAAIIFSSLYFHGLLKTCSSSYYLHFSYLYSLFNLF